MWEYEILDTNTLNIGVTHGMKGLNKVFVLLGDHLKIYKFQKKSWKLANIFYSVNMYLMFYNCLFILIFTFKKFGIRNQLFVKIIEYLNIIFP
jgi:hypothetical protein